jgi:site-specific recombinase XerD
VFVTVLLDCLKAEGLSQNTISDYFKALKAFTRWMARRGWTERDRFEDVRRRQPVRPKFDTLTTQEKQAILSSFNPDCFLGARNLAIVRVFMDTGVRLGELIRLERDRVRPAEGYVEVFAPKTDDWRIIPLSTEAGAVCQGYLRLLDKLLITPVRPRSHRLTSAAEGRHQQATTFFITSRGEPMTEKQCGADAHTAAEATRHLGRHPTPPRAPLPAQLPHRKGPRRREPVDGSPLGRPQEPTR